MHQIVEQFQFLNWILNLESTPIFSKFRVILDYFLLYFLICTYERYHRMTFSIIESVKLKGCFAPLMDPNLVFVFRYLRQKVENRLKLHPHYQIYQIIPYHKAYKKLFITVLSEKATHTACLYTKQVQYNHSLLSKSDTVFWIILCLRNICWKHLHYWKLQFFYCFFIFF